MYFPCISHQNLQIKSCGLSCQHLCTYIIDVRNFCIVLIHISLKESRVCPCARAVYLQLLLRVEKGYDVIIWCHHGNWHLDWFIILRVHRRSSGKYISMDKTSYLCLLSSSFAWNFPFVSLRNLHTPWPILFMAVRHNMAILMYCHDFYIDQSLCLSS